MSPSDSDSELTSLSDDDEDQLQPSPLPPPPPAAAQHVPALKPSANTQKKTGTNSGSTTKRVVKPKSGKEENIQRYMDRAPNSRTLTAEALYNEICGETINLEPDYQREVVWTDAKQIHLLDSLYHNFFVPPVLFAVDPSNDQKTCIDGKQRLSSIKRFMDGEIPFKDSRSGVKYWYCNPQGKAGRKVMSENMKKKFKGAGMVVAEYYSITREQEREIFQFMPLLVFLLPFCQSCGVVVIQRVQNGMALTPAERMHAINGPRADLVRRITNLVLSEEGFDTHIVWESSRGKGFQSVASILFMIYEDFKNNLDDFPGSSTSMGKETRSSGRATASGTSAPKSTRKKTNKHPQEPSVQKIEEWLQNPDGDVPPEVELDMWISIRIMIFIARHEEYHPAAFTTPSKKKPGRRTTSKTAKSKDPGLTSWDFIMGAFLVHRLSKTRMAAVSGSSPSEEQEWSMMMLAQGIGMLRRKIRDGSKKDDSDSTRFNAKVYKDALELIFSYYTNMSRTPAGGYNEEIPGDGKGNKCALYTLYHWETSVYALKVATGKVVPGEAGQSEEEDADDEDDDQRSRTLPPIKVPPSAKSGSKKRRIVPVIPEEYFRQLQALYGNETVSDGISQGAGRCFTSQPAPALSTSSFSSRLSSTSTAVSASARNAPVNEGQPRTSIGKRKRGETEVSSSKKVAVASPSDASSTTSSKYLSLKIEKTKPITSVSSSHPTRSISSPVVKKEKTPTVKEVLPAAKQRTKHPSSSRTANIAASSASAAPTTAPSSDSASAVAGKNRRATKKPSFPEDISDGNGDEADGAPQVARRTRVVRGSAGKGKQVESGNIGDGRLGNKQPSRTKSVSRLLHDGDVEMHDATSPVDDVLPPSVSRRRSGDLNTPQPGEGQFGQGSGIPSAGQQYHDQQPWNAQMVPPGLSQGMISVPAAYPHHGVPVATGSPSGPAPVQHPPSVYPAYGTFTYPMPPAPYPGSASQPQSRDPRLIPIPADDQSQHQRQQSPIAPQLGNAGRQSSSTRDRLAPIREAQQALNGQQTVLQNSNQTYQAMQTPSPFLQTQPNSGITAHGHSNGNIPNPDSLYPSPSPDPVVHLVPPPENTPTHYQPSPPVDTSTSVAPPKATLPLKPIIIPIGPSPSLNPPPANTLTHYQPSLPVVAPSNAGLPQKPITIPSAPRSLRSHHNNQRSPPRPHSNSAYTSSSHDNRQFSPPPTRTSTVSGYSSSSSHGYSQRLPPPPSGPSNGYSRSDSFRDRDDDYYDRRSRNDDPRSQPRPSSPRPRGGRHRQHW
ncbi:hypothetical protein D9758_014691 [Tetrapyrgos nigripes]|uniref:GmrSD restriction endonucleases N-terminal domain-containing protein n=1 Tax=Tetrapyrgos nigripes TaxID=182062 RepID=A0A8H5CKZ4_9AGAR|nr:hypothetical protein D9758_014691 [Tetrapyrgos nigripes]